ncbi:hypothetical protein [Moorena producens]
MWGVWGDGKMGIGRNVGSVGKGGVSGDGEMGRWGDEINDL